MRKIYFYILFLSLPFQTLAQCKYVWASWQNQGPTDTASASFLINGSTINMKMVTNYIFDFTPSIYNYPAYLSYPDIPLNGIVPQTKWATGAAGSMGRTTVCFSQPVVNPVLLLSSVGSALLTVSLDFSMPFNVLFDGGGNTFVSNISLAGQEGYCILEFPGTITCITITSSTPENYTNLTWGLNKPPTTINQAVSLCNGNTYSFNSHLYSLNGVYYDTLTTIRGCDSVVVTHLTINPNLNSTNTRTICAGGNYLFNNHVYTAAGTYKDTLTSVSGCDSIVKTQLNVIPYYTSNNPQSICQGESYVFNSHIYNTNGLYYDTLRSVGGCDSIIFTSITINPLPVISFLHPPDVCIESNALALNYATPAGGIYSGPGVSNNVFDPQAASVGTHTLTYLYRDPATNCINSLQENIKVLSSPIANLSVTPNYAHLVDAKITFSNLSQGVVSTQWEFGDGFSSTLNRGVHVYDDTGHFQVTLLVTDAFGCSNVTEVTVFIEDEFSFYIPNAFSPDGDGINDYFSGAGSGIDKYTMTIFNRWGDVIFQSADLNKKWNGNNVPADTYVYKINLTDALGLSHEYEGKVSVVR